MVIKNKDVDVDKIKDLVKGLYTDEVIDKKKIKEKASEEKKVIEDMLKKLK